MKKRSGDYHLLVAHNFLSNISLDGSHSDTKLRIFNRRQFIEGATACSNDDGPSVSTREFAGSGAPLVEAGNVGVRASRGSDPACTSSDVKGKLCRRLFLKRFSRMVSSEDTEGEQSFPDEKAPMMSSVMGGVKFSRKSESSDQSTVDDLTMSSTSVSHFTFLRLLRTSLVKDGRSRSYLCAPSGAPLIVTSHFPFQPSSRTRPHLRHTRSSAGSSERLNQVKTVGSVEELRPFDLKEDKHVYFDQLGSQLRRSSVSLSGVTWKSLYREEKQGDLLTNQQSHSFAGSLSGGMKCTDTCGDAVDESDSYNLNAGDNRCNEYDPLMLDDIASATRTIIRSNGFIGVTKLFAPPLISKNMLNETFAEKFPNIHLTYSKMRSIKRDVWELARECGVDECTTAHAFVYFERITIKGLISKYNRKLVAGTALLIAVKLNDYKKPVIVKLLQSAEDLLRISRRDMLSFELPLCSALQFDLFPPIHHVEPHLRKLMFGVF